MIGKEFRKNVYTDASLTLSVREVVVSGARVTGKSGRTAEGQLNKRKPWGESI